MSVVGHASVVVSALTDTFKEDLRRSFADAEGEADASGANAGTRFGDSFNNASGHTGDGINFSGVENRAGSSGAASSDRFARAFDGGFVSPLGGADPFNDLERHAGDSGSRSGIRFGSAFDREAGNVGSDLNKVFDDAAREATPAGSNAGNNFAGAVEKETSSFSMPDIFSGMALKIAAIIPLVGLLGGGLGALVGGAVAVAAAAAYAAGSLSILATGLAAVVLGGGTAMLAFGGIGKVLGLMSRQQATSASTAMANAQAQQAAADAIVSASERVAAAQRAVANADYTLQQAQKTAAESEVRDAHDVAEAEYNLAQAHRDDQAAQEALTKARQDARSALVDLQLQERGAVLNQQEAVLRLSEAQQAYQQVINNPASTADQRRQAQLDLEQAELAVDQAKKNREDLTKQTEDANKKGVSGSDQVVQAREAEKAADHRLQDAEYALAQARQKQADDQVTQQHAIKEAEQGVADAVQNLTDSQHALAEAQQHAADQAKAQTAQQNALKQAMQHLSPQARQFAKFLYSLRPELDKLRAAAGRRLFGPLTDAIKNLVNNFLPTFRHALLVTGGGLGDFFTKLSNAFTFKNFKDNFTWLADAFSKVRKSLGNTSVYGEFGRILGNIVRGITGLARAAFPTFRRFVAWVEQITGSFAHRFEGSKNIKSMTDLISNMGDEAAKFGHILGDIFQIIFHVGQAAFGTGKHLVNDMSGSLDNLVKSTAKGGSDFKRLQGFFTSIVGPLKSVLHFVGALAEGFFHLAENKKLQGMFDSLAKAIPGLAKGIIHFTNDVGPSLISIIRDIIKIVSNLAKDGAIKTFVATLIGIIKTVGAIFKLITGGPQGKILGPIIGAFLAFSVALKGTTKLLKIFGLESVATALKEKLAAIATGIWETVMIAFDAVMDANPIVLLAIAIAALVAGIIIAYKHSKTFRSIIDAIGRVLKSIASVIWKVVITAFNFLKKHVQFLLIALGPLGIAILAIIEIFKHWGAIKKFVGGIIDAVVGFFKKLPGRIIGFVKRVVGDIISFVKKHGQWFLLLLGPLGVAILGIVEAFKHWDAIKKFVGKVIGAVVGFFKSLPGKIYGFLKDIITKLATWYVDFNKWLVTKVGDVVKSVVGFFTGLPGKIWNALTNIISNVHQFAADLFGAFERKVSSIVVHVINFFQSLPGKIETALKHVMVKVGTFVINLVNGLKDKVKTLVDDVVNFFQGLPGRIASVAGKLLNAAQNLAGKIVSGIKNGVQNAIDGIVNGVKALPGRLAGLLTSLAKGALGVGKSIWHGIVNGLLSAGKSIASLAGRLANALIGLINRDVIDKLKNFKFTIGAFGIHHTFQPFGFLPDIPTLPIPGAALGATVLPQAGGTLVRLAEAGRAETVVDTGLINARLRADEGHGKGVLEELQRARAILERIHAMGGVHVGTLEVQAAPKERASESVPRALRSLAFELGS